MKILQFLKNLYKRRVDLNDEKSVWKKCLLNSLLASRFC